MPESRCILVVDDDPEVLGFITATLRMDGYEVHQAPNGPMALQWLASNTPDLLILDIRMWPMTGVDLLERIQARGQPCPPVIIATAYAGEGDTETIRTRMARFAYPVEILTKPFPLEELEAAIASVLAQAHTEVPHE